MTQPLKLCRIVMAPAPTGPGAFNRIVSVVLEEDQDVPRLSLLFPLPPVRRTPG